MAQSRTQSRDEQDEPDDQETNCETADETPEIQFGRSLDFDVWVIEKFTIIKT